MIDIDRDRLAQIEGLVEAPTLERLAELASEVPADQAIVELGSYLGLSACWLAAGSRAGAGARVTCIDSWGWTGLTGEVNEPFERFKENIAALGVADLVTPVPSDTVVAAAGWLQPIGLIFIDAGHRFREVTADYQAWSPFVSPGGHIAFHDYNMPQERGVHQCVENIVVRSGLWDEIEVVQDSMCTWIGRRL